MSFERSPNLRPVFFYLFLMLLACFPIWTVENFISQDAPAHLYNSYIILELLKGNPAFTEIYTLNTFAVPNQTGHWLMAFLLLFFSSAVIIKITATLTFALFVAAVGWLRWQIAGRENIYAALLFGAVLAFNWFWLMGFYNFIFGVIGFTFTLGLYWRWREKLNFSRALSLAILIIFVFLSHPVSFAALAGSMLVIAFFAAPELRRRTLLWTLAAFVPILPFIAGYRSLTQNNPRPSPIWVYLKNPLSVSDWLYHLRVANPFVMILSKNLPFVEETSKLFNLLSPFLWLALAIICFSAAVWANDRKKIPFDRLRLPFFLLALFSALIWVFAPDHFGASHGDFLRARTLLCSLILLVPLLPNSTTAAKARILNLSAHFCLGLIIVFQTLTLWQYSFHADKIGSEFLSATHLMNDTDSFASIVLMDSGCQFKSKPLFNLNVLYGMNKNSRVWDNYEMGYVLFPVKAKNESDRKFTFEFHDLSIVDFCNPDSDVAGQLRQMKSLLAFHHQKIDVMIIWGTDERAAAAISDWYESEPFYQNGNLRLFRHR